MVGTYLGQIGGVAGVIAAVFTLVWFLFGPISGYWYS
jgi:hypothetical protein